MTDIHTPGGHGHDVADWRRRSKSSMIAVLVLTACYMVIEIATGFYTHSLALIADAGHMLSDVGAIVLALVAIWFSSKPATPEKTYGYYRCEILAGFFNALMLVVMSIFILYESYTRLQHPPEVIAAPVFFVACIGAVVNFVSLRLLKRGSEQSLNVRAAYLEVLGDMLATIGVIVSSALILLNRWYIADPIISAAIGVAILPRTWLLLKECINILMEGAPVHIDLGALRRSILAVPGVVDVHDIHVWTITSGRDAMSAHVTIERSPPEVVLTEVTKVVNGFGLHHSTIQVEQVEQVDCRRQGLDACK